VLVGPFLRSRRENIGNMAWSRSKTLSQLAGAQKRMHQDYRGSGGK
jgi:hypothetical protein